MDLSAVAARVVEDCTAVQAGERALVVTDALAPVPLAEHLMSELRRRGAEASHLAVPAVAARPHGYLSWEEPTPVLESALRECDVAIVHMPTLIALSGVVARARKEGTRLLFVPADFDMSRSLLLEEDLDGMAALGDAVCARLAGVRSAELRTPDGTDLRFGALRNPFYDDARARARGHFDGVVVDATLTIDGEPLLVDGAYRVPLASEQRETGDSTEGEKSWIGEGPERAQP